MNVSDKYRKYLISIQLSDKSLFAVWGTDLSDDERDKLIISNAGMIICSVDFRAFKDYLLKNVTSFFDVDNLSKWLLEVNSSDLSVSYDFNNIGHFIKNKNKISDVEKGELIEIVDFLNIALDYSTQIDSSYLNSRLNERNVLMFKDYIYDNFMWNSDLNQIDSRMDNEFDVEKFHIHLLEILDSITMSLLEV